MRVAPRSPEPAQSDAPEVASVGMTEEQAKEAGYDLKIGKFPFSASGKASAAGAKEGFVKLIFDAKYGELLGGHMIGANVTEMIAEIVAIRKLEVTGHELIKTVHPHPTMSEAIMEAAAAAYDEVIHLQIEISSSLKKKTINTLYYCIILPFQNILPLIYLAS